MKKRWFTSVLMAAMLFGAIGIQEVSAMNQNGMQPKEMVGVEDNHKMGPIPDWESLADDDGFYISEGVLYCYIGEKEDVTIPDGVTEIGERAFSDYGNNQIKAVTLPEGLIKIGAYAFQGCTNLKTVVLPDSVTEIASNAFADCENLETIVLSDSLAQISMYAFQGCKSLKTVEIPDSVTGIGGNVFQDCSALTNVTLPKAMQFIPQGMFSNCKSLAEITLPETVESIQTSAFRGCTSLKEIKFPDMLLSIGQEAFFECTGLKNIEIPKTVESVGQAAFYGCTALESAKILSSATSIGAGAFNNCKDITLYCYKGSRAEFYAQNINQVHYEYLDGEPDREGGVYEDFAYIEQEDGTLQIYAYHGNAEKLTVPANINGKKVARIDDAAFHECMDLKEVVISDGITSIGASAFWECGITKITIPDSVTEIDAWAFAWCGALQEITIPGSVKCIDVGMFQYCANLTKVMFGEGVEEIASSIFSNCTNLKEVVIPKSVNSIVGNDDIHNKSSFDGCSGFTIKCYKDSYAEQYAKDNNFEYGYITEECKEGEHTYATETTKKATVSKNGTLEKTCTLCGKKTSSTIYKASTIKLSTSSYVYNGTSRKPSVTVKDSKNKKLTKDKDYTVTYESGRKKVGKYTVTVKLKGNYSGTVKKTFTIKPKETKFSEIKQVSNGFTVKWKKQATQVTGYEIQYSTDSKFAKKNTDTIKIKKSSTTSKKIKVSNQKKKYYVRIRTYKTVKEDGKSIHLYSKWSKAKTMVQKNYMKDLGLKFDLKKGKAITYKSYYAGIGLKNQKAKVTNYKITDAKKEGYKKLTFTVKYTTGWDISEDEIHKMAHACSGGNIGGGFFWAVMDYDTGISLASKNDFDVTVTTSGWKYSDKQCHYDLDGCCVYTSDAKIKITVVYPKSYDGLCIGLGGHTGIGQTKKDSDFWKGKALFEETGYYSKEQPKLSHFMRVGNKK